MKPITIDYLYEMDKKNYPKKTKISKSVAKRLCPDLPRIGYEKRIASRPGIAKSAYCHGTFHVLDELWVANYSGEFYAYVIYCLA